MITLPYVTKNKHAFAGSVDQGQTAQSVLSDPGSTQSNMVNILFGNS